MASEDSDAIFLLRRISGLAGISRVEFLSSLGRYKVFTLEAELTLRECGFRMAYDSEF
jgi:hypothetical protein